MVEREVNQLMVVEDSPADIDLVEECIEEIKRPIDLTVIRDGETFLTELKNYQKNPDKSLPDLILLDIDLPRVNGFELLERIKKSEELVHLPIVVFTMSNAREDILRSYKFCANTCVTKPMGFEELKTTLNEVFDYWFDLAALPESSEV